MQVLNTLLDSLPLYFLYDVILLLFSIILNIEFYDLLDSEIVKYV